MGKKYRGKVIVHIGYHKTGTSWLQERVFRRMKNVWQPYSYDEITNRFVLERSSEFEPEVIRYELEERHQKAKESGTVLLSNERLSGSPHSGGYDQNRTAERIKSVFPNAKVIIGIREQISAIASCYRQYVKSGGTVSIRDYLNPPEGEHIPRFSILFFRYLDLINKYIKLFGSNNVKVMPIEALKKDKNIYLGSLEDFVGKEIEKEKISGDPVNKSLSFISTEIKRRVNKFTMKNDLNQDPIFRIPGGHPACMYVLPTLDKYITDKYLNKKYESIVKKEVRFEEWENSGVDEISEFELTKMGYG